MKRKDFLRGIGLAGVVGVLPNLPVQAKSNTAKKFTGDPACVLIPSETAGPFPLDLTENSYYFRQDVREDRTGVQLNLKLKILGLDNCEPMPNVRVNIWACDKDGNYSGYGNQSGLKYLRGYQIADVHGEVNFVTIFPGWYNGRVCHIHFQVYVSSVYAAVSQLTFPVATKNALYAANPTLYTKGPDALTPNQDMVFSDGYAYQLATLTQNTSGSYDAYLEVTIKGTGTSGLANLEPETGGQFTLGQNYPNPYKAETNVPFVLTNPADVLLELWDLTGKKIARLDQGHLPSGEHSIALNMKTLGVPSGTYAYQLQVSNENGTFRQAKVMTAF